MPTTLEQRIQTRLIEPVLSYPEHMLLLGGPMLTAQWTMTVDEARAFVAEQRWIYAKTMPQWPHEYIIKWHRPDQTDLFTAFVRLILRDGKAIPWPEGSANPRYYNVYLVLDGFKYWTMGPGGGQERAARDDADDRDCINRAAHPDPFRLRSHLAAIATPPS